MSAADFELTFPKWQIADIPPATVSDQAYLEWLSENRMMLIRDGKLEELRNDPARAPVDAPFILR